MTDRQQSFAGQKFVHQLFVLNVGEPDGDVCFVKIDRGLIIIIGAQLHLKIGVFHLKPAQTRHDPAHGKGQRGEHTQLGVIGAVLDLGHRLFDRIKGRRQAKQQVPPGTCQFQAAVLPIKQFPPKHIFKVLHLSADGSLGHVKLM